MRLPAADVSTPAPRADVLSALVALTVYALLAVAITWPVILAPAGTAIGNEGGDQWHSLWGYTWFGRELLAGRIPVAITQLGHPHGGTIFFLDALDGVLAIPLVGPLGAVATYNLLAWGNVVLGALAARQLVGHLTGDRGAGLLGGLLYGFSPYLLGVLTSGITELFTVGWLPLALFQLVRLGETGRWRHAVGAGLLLGATLLGSLYHGMYACMTAALLVGYGLVLRRPRWPLSTVPRLLVVGVLLAAVALPVALTLRASRAEGSSFAEVRPPLAIPEPEPQWRTRSMSLDPANLLLPGKPALIQRGSNTVHHVTFLGWGVLAATIVGAVGGRRRRRAAGDEAFARTAPPPLDDRGERRFWVAVLVVFAVLALGPILTLAGQPVQLGAHYLRLPGAALDALVPFAAMGEFKYRHFVVVTLAQAVLAGWAFALLSRRIAARWRGPALALATALLLAELALLSPAHLPVPSTRVDVPAYCAELADEPGSFAVFDLPFAGETRVFGRYLHLAGIHGKPVPYIFERALHPALFDDPLVADLVDWSRALSAADSAPIPPAGSAEPLLAWGYRELIVHRALAADRAGDARRLQRALDALTARFGPPVRDDGDVVVYRIEGADAPAPAPAPERAANPR